MGHTAKIRHQRRRRGERSGLLQKTLAARATAKLAAAKAKVWNEFAIERAEKPEPKAPAKKNTVVGKIKSALGFGRTKS
jgi:hypothetical protein